MQQRSLRAVQRLAKLSEAPRSFTTTSTLLSGHSRWSKIKHDKGKVDAQKGNARHDLARHLARVSKGKVVLILLKSLANYVVDGGPDPAINSQLLNLIANAKRVGMSKSGIDTAIARGQGVSVNGQALELVNVEFLFPESNIAGILECQTDNKRRLMMVLNHGLKLAGAINTTVAFMFDRRGRIVFKKQDTWDEDDLLEKAIEAGANDVNIEEDEVVVLTETDEVAAIAETMSISLDSKPESQDLVWIPKSDMAVDSKSITEETQAQLDKLFLRVEEEDSSIQETYFNIV